MNVLITGGAGFIGCHTADALIEAGHRVRVLDSLRPPIHPNGRPPHASEGAEFVSGDVTNKGDVARALTDMDAVFHFAAYQDYLPDFSTFFRVNTVGTALLYEILVERKRPLRKVVVASSQAVYGEGRYRCGQDGDFYPDSRPLHQLERARWEIVCPACGRPGLSVPTDERLTNPQNQYAMSKYSQEMVGINLGRRYDIPTVALRYSIVQGPGQSPYNAYSGVCRLFCMAHRGDDTPTIYEDGLQMRDYVNIEDVVRANLLVLERDEADYESFNVGAGRAYTVTEFAGMVARVYGKTAAPCPSGLFRFGDTRHIVSDITKLKALGWEPRHTPEKSVADYKAWLETQPEVGDVLASARKKMEGLDVLREAKGGCRET